MYLWFEVEPLSYKGSDQAVLPIAASIFLPIPKSALLKGLRKYEWERRGCLRPVCLPRELSCQQEPARFLWIWEQSQKKTLFKAFQSQQMGPNQEGINFGKEESIHQRQCKWGFCARCPTFKRITETEELMWPTYLKPLNAISMWRTRLDRQQCGLRLKEKTGLCQETHHPSNSRKDTM